MLFSQSIELNGNALFVSDAHFRTPSDANSRQREEWLIDCLSSHRNSIKHLFFLGDIFDYWFEYGDVVPKGYFRLFNLLYEMNLEGIQMYYFTGNHDMWVQDYFTEQFGCRVFRDQQAFILNGHRCLIGHGDGIGGKQHRYLLIKKIFSFKPNRILYSMLHPRHSFAIARFFSQKSRASHSEEAAVFKKEQEYQVQYARTVLQQEPVEFFIYAHRHIPIRYELSAQSTLYNVGDWLKNFSYITFNQNDTNPVLHFFQQKEDVSRKDS